MGVPPRRFHHPCLCVSIYFLTIAVYMILSVYKATTGGNMIAIENADDFEFYSANSAGGIQGSGYQCRNAG